MITNAKSFVLLSVVAATGIAIAAPSATEKKPAKTEGAAANPGEPISPERKALMRQLRDEREKMVRDRGQIFARIAVKRDYSGEYVLFRDENATAFLDLKDPRHPRYSPEHDEGEAADRRNAHILVVPNQPRETIGKTIASNITADDLEQTLKLMHKAADLATRFGVKNPQIYVKSPARVGVGYLHIHIIGDRDPKVPYPPPLH